MKLSSASRLLILLWPSYLIISGCSTLPNTHNNMDTTSVAVPISTKPSQVSNDVDSDVDNNSIGYSGYAADPNGVELVNVNSGDDAHNMQEPELIGPAQALAIDSKHYAASYGVDHTEAMRRMLIQHDTQEQMEALRSEFGNRILAIGFKDEPEYGVLVVLSGDGMLPKDRILYRDADKLSEPETVASDYKTKKPNGIMLTQSELDKAIELIESPTRFRVSFEISPKGRNLTPQEQQLINQRSETLRKRIPMLTGTSYNSTGGEYVIYVHTDDAKKAGLTKESLEQIGVEVMQMPVRIEWQNGYVYATEQNLD